MPCRERTLLLLARRSLKRSLPSCPIRNQRSPMETRGARRVSWQKVTLISEPDRDAMMQATPRNTGAWRRHGARGFRPLISVVALCCRISVRYLSPSCSLTHAQGSKREWHMFECSRHAHAHCRIVIRSLACYASYACAILILDAPMSHRSSHCTAVCL